MAFKPVEIAHAENMLDAKRDEYLELAKQCESLTAKLNNPNNLADLSFTATKLKAAQLDKSDKYKEIKELEAKIGYLKADNEFNDYKQSSGITNWRTGDDHYRELLEKKLTAHNEYHKLTFSEWEYNKYFLPVYNARMARIGGK